MIKNKNPVIEMYEKQPFPNFGIKSDYITKAEEMRKNIFKGLNLFPEDIKNKVVLVAGCGTGEMTSIYASMGAKKIYALDLCKKHLEITKELNRKLGNKNVKTIYGDVLKIPFENKKFDIVISEGVIHHTENPYKGFTELCRVLKKEGVLVLGLYNKYGKWETNMQRKIARYFCGENPDKIFKFSKKHFAKNSPDSIIYDSYSNPWVESYGAGEIFKWFHKNKMEYRGSFYPLEIGRYLQYLNNRKNVFSKYEKLKKPGILDVFLTQLYYLITKKAYFQLSGTKKTKV